MWYLPIRLPDSFNVGIIEEEQWNLNETVRTINLSHKQSFTLIRRLLANLKTSKYAKKSFKS